MRGSIGALTGVLLVVALSAEGARAASITEPDWLTLPTGEEVAENYPMLAQRLAIEGLVTLACQVDAKGGLEKCTVMSESPKGVGFGQAAIRMTPKFSMRPQSLNGIPVGDGDVRIPIRFKLPARVPQRKTPLRATDLGMPQALRLVDSVGVAGLITNALRIAGALDLYNADGRSDGISQAARAAASNAMRQAIDAHMDDARLEYAGAFAKVFNEKEMSDHADYMEIYAPIVRSNTAYAAAQARLAAAFTDTQRAEARAIFCAAQRCDMPGDALRIWRRADPKDGALDTPVWSTQPSTSSIRREGPAFAIALGVNGVVRLSCKLNKDGQPKGCQVSDEAPAGFGFGVAAIELSSRYRLSSIQLTEVKPDQNVTLRLGFETVRIGAPSAPPAANEENLSLARRFVADDETSIAVRRNVEVTIVGMAKLPKGADPKLFDAGLVALRSGTALALAKLQENRARAGSTAFSAEQLRAMVAYQDSPSSKAQKDRSEALTAATEEAYVRLGERIAMDARELFCREQDCDILGSAPNPAVSGKLR